MADEVVKSTFAQLQSDLMKRSELVSQIGERSGFANHKSERSRFAQVHVKALESRVALLARKQISFFCGHITLYEKTFQFWLLKMPLYDFTTFENCSRKVFLEA
jgi:hypothetical protein